MICRAPVADIDEMEENLCLMWNHLEVYWKARQAKKSNKPYLWPVLIKKYEDYFESLVAK